MKAQGSGARALIVMLFVALTSCASTPKPANLEQVRAKSADTPLMIAAARGDRRIVQLLLSAGANVNATGATGDTPVSLAARAGNLSAVKALLEAGANVNVSQRGRSLLMQVVEGGDLLTAEALLAAGADVNFVDSSGITALDLARARNNRDLEMLLIQAGADS